MGIQVSSHASSPIRIYPGSIVRITYTPVEKFQEPLASKNFDAFVYNVDPAAAEKSMEKQPNAPLSDIEKQQLFQIYTELGREHPLWEKIGTVLNEALFGNDRTNFLAVLSEAGEQIPDFVEQVIVLEEEERSLYLNTALRNGSGHALENLVDAVKNLSGQSLTDFLIAADGLGRSSESIKTGELQNFIASVAQLPGALDNLIEKISTLNDEDRSLFLAAAATAEDDLGFFIDTLDFLSDSDLTRFLEVAVAAGNGLNDLLTVTGSLAGEKRSDFLQFAAQLETGNIENFLVATQGNQNHLDSLIAITRELKAGDREDYLSIAAKAGVSFKRLNMVVDSLADNSALRSTFLSTAVRAEARLTDFLGLIEKLGGKDRATVLSFGETLGFTDLNTFITAGNNNILQAAELSDTAAKLNGKEKSYLLYAASLHREYVSDLTAMTRQLGGQERRDFLFTVANILPSQHRETPDVMDQFFRTAQSLTGTLRKDFFAGERMLSSLGEQSMSKEYVYLKSVFDEAAFDAVLTAGENIDALISSFDSLETAQRETFFSTVKKADKKMLPDLMSVLSRLDADRSDQFLAFANSLGTSHFSNLIAAADTALGQSGKEMGVYDRLIETAQSLDPSLDAKFLNVAAKAETNLEKLMDLTDQFTGFLQADFLVAAEAMADRSQGLLDNFLDTSEHLLDKGFMDISHANGKRGRVRPSDIIQGEEFKGSYRIEGFFKATLFLENVGISNSHMNEWLNTWQGIRRPAVN